MFHYIFYNVTVVTYNTPYVLTTHSSLYFVKYIEIIFISNS